MKFFQNQDNSYESVLSEHELAAMLVQPQDFWAKILSFFQDGQRVLDIGVGSGILARLVRLSGKQLTIDGIEPNLARCEIAKPLYNKIYAGYVDEFLEQLAEYDLIIMSEVIEHTIDPDVILAQIIAHKKPQACLVVTTPNIANGLIRSQFIQGEFNYSDSGFLDKTHLRFFTQASLKKMIYSIVAAERVGFDYVWRDDFLTEAVWRNNLSFANFLLLLNDPSSFIYHFIVSIDGPPEREVEPFSVRQGVLSYKYLKLRIKRWLGLYPASYRQ